jgi:pentatricopeptide repeat protein
MLRRHKSLFLLEFIASRGSSSSIPPIVRSKSEHFSRPQPSLADIPLESSNTTTLFNRLQQRIDLLNHVDKWRPSDPEAEIFDQTVNNLHQALRTQDLHTACMHWSRLRKENLLRYIGPPRLESYSRLLAAACITLHPRDPWPWNTNTQEVMKEIALLTACRGATEALNTLLMQHIKRRQPAPIFELYRRYVELSGEKEVWECAENEEGEDSLAPTSVTDHTSYIPGQVHIILAVLTAHAMQDSFHEALKMTTSGPMRFNRYTVKEFLKSLDQFPELQEKVEEYGRDLTTAKKVAEPAVLVKRIMKLDKNPYHLERLYDSVIDGLTKPNAYIAAIPSAVSTRKPILMPEAAWSAFLNGFVKNHRLDLAERIWDDMNKLGITPSVSVWTALFNGYDSIRAVDETVMSWQSMLEQGTQPDGNAYRALIAVLFNGHRPADAMERFTAFKNERARRETEHVHGKQKQGLRPFQEAEVLHVYNTTLYGLLWHSNTKNASQAIVVDSSRRNWAATANDLLKEMEESGPKPDIITYNTVMRYHGRRGDIQGITSTLQRIADAGLVADVFTYTTLLSALLKVGREDAPGLVIALMRKHGIEPNVATYTAIITQQIREGDEKGVSEAFKMLKRMEQEPHLRPNQITFTTVLAAIHRGIWADRQAAEECQQYIVSQMKAREMQLDRTAYNILLVACMENHTSEGWQNALKYYKEMVQRGILVSNETWYILLHGLVVREEWNIADAIVDEMNGNEVGQTRGPLWKLIQAVNTRTWRKARWSPRR